MGPKKRRYSGRGCFKEGHRTRPMHLPAVLDLDDKGAALPACPQDEKDMKL